MGFAASFWSQTGNDSILQPRCQRRFATARLAHQDHWQAILQTLLDAHQFDEIVHLSGVTTAFSEKLRQWGFFNGKKKKLSHVTLLLTSWLPRK